MESRMTPKPRFHLSVLVRGIIVGDQMQIEGLGRAASMARRSDPFLVAMRFMQCR